MSEHGPPLVKDDLIGRLEALMVADALSINALQTNSHDFADAIQALDASLAWLSGLFDSLSTRRDAMKRISLERSTRQPVARPIDQQHQHSIFMLPSELLVTIFEHLADLEPLGEVDAASDSDNDTDDSDALSLSSFRANSTYSAWSAGPIFSLGWTRVTHVFHSWRELAIGTPTLWRTIPLDLCEDWVNELVRRSGCTPVDVLIPCDAKEDTIRRYLLNIGVSRIRSIVSESLHVDAFDIFVAGFVANQAAGLLVLEEFDSLGSTSRLAYLADIPSLRKFHISVNPLHETLRAPSRGTRLPNLSELSFATTDDAVVPMSPLWLGIFQSLTVLRLDLVRFSFGDPNSLSATVELPRLRELELIEQGIHCGAFIRRLVIPPSARYNVQCTDPIFRDIDAAAVVYDMAFVRALENKAKHFTLRLLVIAHNRSRDFPGANVRLEMLAQGWHNVRIPNSDDRDPPNFQVDDAGAAAIGADISQVVKMWEPAGLVGPFLPHFMCTLLAHPSLSALQMLSLELDPSLNQTSANEWADVLRPMTQLLHIRLTSPYLPIIRFRNAINRLGRSGTPLNLLKALASSAGGDLDVAPWLRSLTLVDWAPNVDAHGHSLYSEDQNGDIRSDLDQFPCGILQHIIVEREGILTSVYIKSWRIQNSAEWRAWVEGISTVEIVYEDLCVSLDHIRVTKT